MPDQQPADDRPTASIRSGNDGGAPPTLPMAPAGMGERPGDRIGPYTILEVIGEGGFGVVYLAERREPMVQRVALKIIKPGMDSKAVVARFEQERQALAVMDHPNVAKVFDGGVTERGLPYFVMEHVPGEPITAFCDRHTRTIPQRLELFASVCDAVQHAHTKGIIHRDLKPSNVLAEMVDGKPVVKVIDFGIAKATDASAVQHSVFSMEGQFIGTPEYMSPEQAGGHADIDTRTDVYALGVTLYELLVGTLPFDPVDLRRRGFDEIRRIIREEEPPRPSTRLSTVKDSDGRIASTRRESHASIIRCLRRELEWIPLKAMRKERDRRYESAAAMAEDIRRYLDGRALRAAPESRVYTAQKFVRRNRVLVGAASAVFLALAAGLAGTIWQAREAAHQRDEAVLAGRSESRQRAEAERQRVRADERAVAAMNAEAAATAARDAERERADQLKQVSDFQSQMLSQIDTTKAGMDLMADVRERFAAALEKADVPEAERTARVEGLRRELVRVNATDTAAALIDRTILKPAIKAIDEQFKDQPAVDAQLRQALADLYKTLGLYSAAYPLQEAALTTRRRVLGEQHPDTMTSINNMGALLQSLGKFAEAEPYIREGLEKRRLVLGEEHRSTILSLHSMGYQLQMQGKLAEAEPYYREAVEKGRRVLGEDHPRTLTSINNLGGLMQLQGKLADAAPYYSEVLEKRRRVLGEEDPSTLSSISNMGMLLQAQGKLDLAEPYFRESLEKRRRVLGEEHPDTLLAINNMGFILEVQGRIAEAEPYYREALEKRRRVLGEEHPSTLSSINSTGVRLQLQGKPAEAEPYVREALEKFQRVKGPEHPDTLLSLNNMGMVLQAQGKFEQADPYLREALEKRRRVLGEEHQDTLVSITNMGILLQAQGHLDQAEPYLREAMEKFRRKLGPEHWMACASAAYLGGLLQKQGKHQEAIDLLTPIEPPARKAFTGGNATRLAGLLTTLGVARVGLGYEAERFALAEANLLEAHGILSASRNRGPAHKETLASVRGLIDLYTAWNTAEPGKGYDAKASDWRAKLDTAKPEPAQHPAAEKK